MAGSSPDTSGYSERLCKAERDLELAAQIGQSLLEQNRDLQARNEFLEENLAASADTIVQLNHELHKRIELLRVYSYYDDDDEMGNDDTSLRQRIDKLLSENRRLKTEATNLQKEVDGVDEKARKQISELVKQVEAANDKIDNLHSAIQIKHEECIVQTNSIEKLLQEIALRHGKERRLLIENEEITKQLEDATDRQNALLTEMQVLQDDYVELKGMFYEAEEELIKFRQQAPHHRSRSFDSVYDSLASELENSDTGIMSVPTSYRSMKPAGTFHLNLQDVCADGSDAVEVDVPSAVLRELSRKTFMIDNEPPMVPLQTPQTEIPENSPLSIPQHQLSFSEELAAKPKVDSSENEEFDELDELKPIGILGSSVQSEASTSTAAPCVIPEIKIKNMLLCDASTSTDFPTTSSEEVPSRTIRLERRNLLTCRGQSFSIGLNLVNSANSLQKSDSTDSLDDYVAPKLGEPGIPGTRDLDFSLKVLKAKQQVEQDFARFCRRKGLTPRNFCSSADKKTPRRSSANDDWVNYSIMYSNECQRQLSSPLRAAVSSYGFLTSSEGVVTRNSLSPGNVQQLPPTSHPEPNGLASITGGSIFSSDGILKRL